MEKVTRKIRSKLITEHVNKAVAERKKWAKFGEEKGKKAGPDLSTTTIGENIPLKLGSATGKVKMTAGCLFSFDLNVLIDCRNCC